MSEGWKMYKEGKKETNLNQGLGKNKNDPWENRHLTGEKINMEARRKIRQKRQKCRK